MSKFLPSWNTATIGQGTDLVPLFTASNVPQVHQYGSGGEYPRMPASLTSSPYGDRARLGVREDQYPDSIHIARFVIAGVFVNPQEEILSMVPIVPFEGETIKIEAIISHVSPWGPLANQAPLPEIHLKRRAFTAVMQAFGRQFTIDGSIRNLPLGEIYRSTHMQQLIDGAHMTIYVEFYKTLLNGYTAPALEYMASLSFDNLDRPVARANSIDLMSRMTGCMGKKTHDSTVMPYIAQTARQLLQRVTDYPQIDLNTMIIGQQVVQYLTLNRRAFASSVTDQNLKVIRDYLKHTVGISPDLAHLQDIADWDELVGLKVHVIKPVMTEEPGNLDLLTHDFATVQFAIVPHGAKFQMWDYFNNRASAWLDPEKDAIEIYKFSNVDTHIASKTRYSLRRYLVMRTVRLRTQTMVLAHMSDKTGMVFMGGSFGNAYDEPALRRDTTMMAMQFGIALYHPQHVIIFPDATFQKYIKGGGVGFYTGDASSYQRDQRDANNGDLVVYDIPNTCRCPTAGDQHADCSEKWARGLASKDWINAGGAWDDADMNTLVEAARTVLNPCGIQKFAPIYANRDEMSTMFRSTFGVSDLWRHGFHGNACELAFRASYRIWMPETKTSAEYFEDYIGTGPLGTMTGPAARYELNAIPVPKTIKLDETWPSVQST